MKLRNDTVNKLTVIESNLEEENKRRRLQEKQLMDRVEDQISVIDTRFQENSEDMKIGFDVSNYQYL